MPIYIKAKDGKKLKFYTSDEVFDKYFKSEKFRKAYYEEYARLTLVSEMRRLRKEKKMTQKTVAQKAKMPQSAIARLESGNHRFSMGTFFRIAKALGKEVQLV